MRDIAVGRLTEKVPAEQQASADLRILEVRDQIATLEAGVRLHGQCEAEPARL